MSSIWCNELRRVGPALIQPEAAKLLSFCSQVEGALHRGAKEQLKPLHPLVMRHFSTPSHFSHVTYMFLTYPALPFTFLTLGSVQRNTGPNSAGLGGKCGRGSIQPQMAAW